MAGTVAVNHSRSRTGGSIPSSSTMGTDKEMKLKPRSR